MNKFMPLFAGLLLATTISAWADDNDTHDAQRLNVVTVPLQAQQWLTTKTALVTVSVNAAVPDKDTEKMRNQVMQKLSQIAATNDWHVTSFNRQQDNSGLENIQMTAEARLNQTDLNGLRDKAKSISKAGETYNIANVEFSPSDEEIRAANIALRNDIYQQVKAEVAALNAMYPTQTFYVHQINFLMQPMPMPTEKNMVYAASMAAPSSAAMPVGTKATLTATVELASDPAPLASH